MKTLSIHFRLLTSILVFASSGIAIACSCLYGGKFEEFSQTNPIIVRASISHYGNELRINTDYFENMVVKVSEVVKGELPHGDLVLQGDTGMSCSYYITVNRFPIGNEYLFSLTGSESVQMLPGCGESSVLINGAFVEGVELTDSGYDNYRIQLEEFIERIR